MNNIQNMRVKKLEDFVGQPQMSAFESSRTPNPISFTNKSNMNLQNFSMPRATILYMIKAHKSLDLHRKFMRMCKYTFDRNRVVPVYDIDYRKWDQRYSWTANWSNCWNGRIFGDEINLENGNFQLWILQSCFLGMFEEPSKPDAISNMLTKTYRLDSDISLIGQRLSLDEFKFLCLGTINHMSLAYGSIKTENGSIVPIRKILDCIPKTKIVEYHFMERIDKKIVMEETADIIATLSGHTEIESFEIHGLTNEFDIDSIDSFLMDTKHKKFRLHFDLGLSESYTTKLESIIAKIVKDQDDKNLVGIFFYGQNENNFYKMAN